ncbi:MAG: hypothetical protein Ct9H300mP11_16210 [Chloroflexota bacterium]|nr:MAG: hypothetical protein Ct9H300mP11_16210 [Chloroflexota bacterium]
MGECLAEIGYKDMVAMDLSQGMLEEAKSKNVYSGFDQMALGGDLDYATDEFDAVISVGVLLKDMPLRIPSMSLRASLNPAD